MHLEEAHAHLLVDVPQRGGADIDLQLPLDQHTSLEQVHMRLLPKEGRRGQRLHLLRGELPCIQAHLGRPLGIQRVLITLEAPDYFVDRGKWPPDAD